MWARRRVFPAPARLPGGQPVWLASEVESWMRERLVERDQQAAAVEAAGRIVVTPNSSGVRIDLAKAVPGGGDR